MIDPISWNFAWPYILTAFIGGYSIGSVPFGLVFTKLSGLGDIRDIGSGNIGATNVLRTGKKGIAAATLLADILKGAFAALAGCPCHLHIRMLGTQFTSGLKPHLCTFT